MNGILFRYVYKLRKDQKWAEAAFRQVYMAAFASLLLALEIGLVDAFSSTAIVDMDRKDSPVQPSDYMKTWFASVHDFGELTGCLVAIFICDKFGRLMSLIMGTLPCIVGWICIIYAQTSTTIIAGRILTGLSNGLAMAIVPTYLIEISTTSTRGFLGASFEMFDVVGILLSNVIGSYVRWTQLAFWSGSVSVASLCLLIFMPESPRHLVAIGATEEAAKTLRFLHGSNIDAEAEVAAIAEDLGEQRKIMSSSEFKISDMREEIFWKPTVLVLVLTLWKQVCASCIFMYYTVWIFESTETSLDSHDCAMIVTAVQVLFTFISMLIMDKFNRRTLLIISSIVMMLSLGVLGLFFFLKEHDINVNENIMNYIPIASVTVYFIFYSIGWGPIPWLMMSELAPLKIRSLVAGLSTCLNSTLAFATTKTFLDIQLAVGKSGTYWIYGGTCLLSMLFVWLYLPETRGRPLEDILELFTSKKVSRKKSHAPMDYGTWAVSNSSLNNDLVRENAAEY